MTIRPYTSKPVPRVARAGSETWWFVPRIVKCVHATGRTCPNVGSIATQEDVDRLVKEFGTYYEKSRRLSITQQLDLIATEILRVDRLANTPHAHWARNDYLSPRQFLRRSQREFSFPNLDAVAQMMKDSTYRSKSYARRVTDRPIGPKSGDHYYVWTLPPKKVGVRDV